MKKIFLTLLLIQAVFLYSEEKKSVNPDIITFDEKDAQKEQKKLNRSATSLLNSGNKFGIKVGFNSTLNDYPTLVGTFNISIPFAKLFAIDASIGANTIVIDKYVDNNQGINVTSNGTGVLNFINIAGIFKWHIQSFWIGTGLSYSFFLGGYIEQAYSPTNLDAMLGQTSGATITGKGVLLKQTISKYPNSLYALLSFGYLAEIKPNVFFAPEIQILYNLPPASTRIMILGLISLNYRL